MFSTVVRMKTDLAFHRTWCRLECGHEVLTVEEPWIGLPVDCIACSYRQFQDLLPGEVYALFLKKDPSSPVLFLFQGYKWGRSSGCFKDLALDKRQHFYASDVAAIEVL